MDYDEWYQTYKPIKNHFNEDASLDGFLFMHYGEEWKFVREFDRNIIWTLILTDLDDDSTSWDIINGVRIVDREGYIVTEVPYEAGDSLLLIKY